MFFMYEISRKRSSVLSNHLSRFIVTNKLKRYTRKRGGQPLNVSLFDLAPGGVYIAIMSPWCWWALTSPFHPYLIYFNKLKYIRRYLSVALSFKSPWLDVIQHPALWSSDFPLLDLSLAAIACLTRKNYLNTY